eukprot:EG_transcript_20381
MRLRLHRRIITGILKRRSRCLQAWGVKNNETSLCKVHRALYGTDGKPFGTQLLTRPHINSILNFGRVKAASMNARRHPQASFEVIQGCLLNLSLGERGFKTFEDARARTFKLEHPPTFKTLRQPCLC